MECTPGDRVELVATNDPYTRLRPGDRGTITNVTDRPEPTIDIAWDNGSTLAILPDAGDRIRLLPSHAADPPPSSPPKPPSGVGRAMTDRVLTGAASWCGSARRCRCGAGSRDRRPGEGVAAGAARTVVWVLVAGSACGYSESTQAMVVCSRWS